MTPIKLRTESPPSESLLRCPCVVYRDDYGVWRCSEREWARMLAEQQKEKRS